MPTITDKRDDQRVLLEKLGDALDDARRELDRLWRLHQTEFGAEDEYLRDGNLTDVARKRLIRLFEEGKRNSEIADFFGISDSAVAYHRKRWRQLQGARVSQRR